jgi:hypothetical protein
MVNSQVPKVEQRINGDTELTVQVVGFGEGKRVEVYGYITQDNGLFARFSGTKTVPAIQPDGSARFTVTVPADQMKLTAGEPVTVLTWVSDIWPSMLVPDPPPTDEFTASWKINQDAGNGPPSGSGGWDG